MSYEYSISVRNRMEKAFRKVWGSDIVVDWEQMESVYNTDYKIDATIICDNGRKRIQIKLSETYPNFSVKTGAFNSYMLQELPLEGLVACVNGKDMYLIRWSDFKSYININSRDTKKIWYGDEYVVVLMKPLLNYLGKKYKKVSY